MRKDFLGRRGTPVAVVRPDGGVATDPVDMLRRWREYGRTLGRERPIRLDDTGGTGASGTDTDFDDVFAQRVLQQVAGFSLVDDGIPELDAEVSLEEVQKEVRRLEGGKAGWNRARNAQEGGQGHGHGGAFGFVAQPGLAEAGVAQGLAGLTSCPCLKNFKGEGSQLDPRADNYRLLAISSVVMKLFEKILRGWPHFFFFFDAAFERGRSGLLSFMTCRVAFCLE
jgi:hypothetical protein